MSISNQQHLRNIGMLEQAMIDAVWLNDMLRESRIMNGRGKAQAMAEQHYAAKLQRQVKYDAMYNHVLANMLSSDLSDE